MAIRCPACNKADQTAAACTRCGCDLTQLHAIVQSAAHCLAEARAALTAADWPAALVAAEQSWQLLHSAEAARLGFLAAGAAGETDRALQWRCRARPAAA